MSRAAAFGVPRALACSAAFALAGALAFAFVTPPATAAPSATPADAAPGRPAGWPDVTAAVSVEDGQLQLALDAADTAFSVDTGALRFGLRPYRRTAVDALPATPLAVRAGPGRGGASFPGSQRSTTVVPLVLPRDVAPGMHVLAIDAPNGFVRAPNGRELRVGNAPHVAVVNVYWPDVRDGDAALRDVRARFAGRVVHGYGGITVGCPNAAYGRSGSGLGWGERHGPADGVRLAGVRRDAGRTAMLTAGSLGRDVVDAGFHFIAVDPLALQIASPSGKPYRAGVAGMPCDLAFVLADPWQVDQTLTTAPAPRAAGPNGALSPIAAGMSRDDVVWRSGYPSAYETIAQFRGESTWVYDAPAPFLSTVTFANERVTAYSPPGRLP